MKFVGFLDWNDATAFCQQKTDENAKSFGVWNGDEIYIVSDAFDYCTKHLGEAVFVGL